MLLHRKPQLRSDQFFLSYDTDCNAHDIPEQRSACNGYCRGCKRLGNINVVADSGNIARVQRRIVSQCQNQVAVVINAAALDSDTVLSVNAVLTVFSVRTVLAVSADDFTEIGNNAIGKRDNQIAVGINFSRLYSVAV